MSNPIENRYDFSLFFEVINGNPNGDPDAGNMPRTDIETGLGLVTDVCIKRKVRNYVELIKNDEAPYRIYIQNRETLNALDGQALAANGVNVTGGAKDATKKAVTTAKKTNEQLDKDVAHYMCDNFFDVRTFGAVMTTFSASGLNCGQIRGPIQMGFAQSIDPIMPAEITITREAVTTEEDAATKRNTMGNKWIVPYGLYRMDGYVSAALAQKLTGFNDDDLNLFWQSLINMFEFDRAASRGNMATRKLFVFKHSDILGDAPSYKLFDSIRVERNEDTVVPRHFEDYNIDVDTNAIPDTVSLTEMVDNVTMK